VRDFRNWLWTFVQKGLQRREIGEAVELLDLALLHVPEIGPREVELRSGRLDDGCGRLERPGEGELGSTRQPLVG